MLVDRGFSLTHAAALISLLSVGFLPGVLSSGYLIDRFSPRIVAAGFFTMPILGFLMMRQAATGRGLVVAVLLLGIGVGATVQLIPALVGWCFGLRAFSEIYGMVMAAFGLGTVSGPLLIGWLWDLTGSDDFMPVMGAGVVALATGLVVSLRRYQEPRTAAAIRAT